MDHFQIGTCIIWSAPGICSWASILFLLYIDDIYQSISHTSVLMFADDIALYKEIVSSSDQDMLQADLSKVFEWSRKWQLNLNSSKCETICISYKRSPPPASYRLNNPPNLLYDTLVYSSIPTLSGRTMSSILLQRQLDS